MSLHKLQITGIAFALIGFLLGLHSVVTNPNLIGWLGAFTNICFLFFWVANYQKPSHKWLCVYSTAEGGIGRIFITSTSRVLSENFIVEIEKFIRNNYQFKNVVLTNIQYLREHYES